METLRNHLDPKYDLVDVKFPSMVTFDEPLDNFHSQKHVWLRINITGIVQGVGFRPMVWRYANKIGLIGQVYNDNQGVVIIVGGKFIDILKFINQIVNFPPALAKLNSIDCKISKTKVSTNEFTIVESEKNKNTTFNSVGPDAAICEKCLEDIKDPDNRRYKHPFTNCTECGPRLSIVKTTPYDRKNTSMSEFDLCSNCKTEYKDPADRRFHAQPNACLNCGPRLYLLDTDKKITRSNPIAAASKAIKAGKVLAIKGIGGFQLVVDATNYHAVRQLRIRKQRQHKPFAIMVKDVHQAQQIAHLTEYECRVLSSAQSPIVLARKKQSTNILFEVAPEQAYIGLFLPTTALHYLLLDEVDSPLVMTSANAKGNPQEIENTAAIEHLKGIADTFLLHNREIIHRLDDSVIQMRGNNTFMLRRARGYAPEPIQTPPGFSKMKPVLAMGADLKNTACLLSAQNAVLTQHFGDLDNPSNINEQIVGINAYQKFLDFIPNCIAVDLHPHYQSSALGIERSSQIKSCCKKGKQIQYIQHHHAHIASCLGENKHSRTDGKVVGIVLDGLGYADPKHDPYMSIGEAQNNGTQKCQADLMHNIWGGEVILADYSQGSNLGGLKPVPLLGGDKANIQPYRNTLAHLHQSIGWKHVVEQFGDLSAIQIIKQKPVETLLYMQDNKLNSPLSSSCGRLFDAVSFLIGACSLEEITFEGQSAMALEQLTMIDHCVNSIDAYQFTIESTQNRLQIDPGSMWLQLLEDLVNGIPATTMSKKFHQGLANTFAKLAITVATRHKLNTVVLSGGVFSNRYLSNAIESNLDKQGLKVLTHSKVPANDGGISLGQALIAASRELDEQIGANLCV